jgi:hypothetical protein
MYEGLLGAPQSQALSRQSNIAGLLGAAAALAAGMSRQGPRRSGLQNVLGALGAGYGASGQAYNQGLQNFSAAQQLQVNTEKQKAFADAAAKYPDLAPLARIDPAKFVEMVSKLEQQRPIAEAYKQAQQPVQQAAPVATQADIDYQNRLAEYKKQEAAAKDEFNNRYAAGDGSNVGVTSAPFTETGVPTTAPLVNRTVISPVPSASGQYDSSIPERLAPPVPPAPVVQPAPQVDREAELRNDKNTLLRVNANLTRLGTKEANDEVKNNLEQIKNLDTQIQQLAVGGFDFQKVRSSLPKEFQNRVDVVEELAKKGSLNGEQISLRLQSIQEKATEQQQKLKDYTNEVRRTAKELYPVTPLDELDQDQMRRLNLVIENRAKARGAAGATRLNVGDKVLAGERAKSQSKAEDNAINALNAASDVRAIVDVLKPYRGGALQDLAGSVGAYLPGTKLEQLATAKQVAEAIRAKLAPTLRVEGSGSTSDKDMNIFMSAIPSLFNTDNGRELIATYADKLAARSVAAADIRSQLIENGTYSVKRFQQELERAGLTTVFTPEDLQILQQNKPVGGGVRLSNPEAQQVYEKYKPR